MTKQEKIKEGIAARLLAYMIPHYKNNPELAEMVFDELLKYLHDNNVVIKVAYTRQDNQEFPVAVESLIGE